MSLEYAILGFLNYSPLSGYDLKKVFDNSVRHFWPADQSQIYRTLARLAEQGYVEQEIVRGLDRHDRKEYHITSTGRAALRAWLLTPLTSHDVRIAALIQVFFAGQLSDEQILALFERLAAEARATLAAYDEIPQPAEADAQAAGMQRERFFWGLTLEYGIMSARMDLAWFESVMARVRAGELPPSPAGLP
ncbi:PadR family transcriptional regulator [Candidatus Amarolinea aalborgensis]|jgi:DNA-binding PadR family transcriptional regulator|uniref:PadR family transcriptional regulator n=1 Tax=Candidatus Amarolinea aalborgensis TaxID=2249329 RepID=UPI003BF96A38